MLAILTRFGDFQRYDDSLEAWAGVHREPLLRYASVASLLGEKFMHPVIAGLSALVLWLLRGDALDFVIPLACASLGGITAHHLVKVIYRRARPESALQRKKYEPAFPSGHTTNSTSVLATSAFIFVHEGIIAAPLAVVIVIVLATSTGLSRVALGWHWGSDVIGGWLTGIGVASLCATIYLMLR